ASSGVFPSDPAAPAAFLPDRRTGSVNKIVLFGIGSSLVVEYEESCRRLGIAVAAGVQNRDGAVYASGRVKVLRPEGVGKSILAVRGICHGGAVRWCRPGFPPGLQGFWGCAGRVSICTRSAGTKGACWNSFSATTTRW